MSKLDLAKSIAKTYLDEIEANIEIRQTYNNIIIAHSATLFQALSYDENAKGNLKAALKYKTTDPNAFYKPLLVQIHGIFENYIRSLVSAVIEERFEIAEKYSTLNKVFRDEYIRHAAHILKYIKSGSIMGTSYNFDDLLASLGRTLSNQTPFKLHPEIYTKLMGNCTSSRIIDLFNALELPRPFSEPLGNNIELKKYFSENKKGRVANLASETLDEQIDLRNDIVHGELTRSIDLTSLKESLNFFRALISALDQLVSNAKK